jgi:hypothetical protein
MEVFQLFGLHETLLTKEKMKIAHLTPNHSSTHYLLNMLREDNEDVVLCENFDFATLYNTFITNKYPTKLDLLLFEFNRDDYASFNSYINNMVLVFLILTKYQAAQGTCIIKLDSILYKAIVDIVFIFTNLYNKVYLIKPSISNITKGDRYIVCKTFHLSTLTENQLNEEVEEKILKPLNGCLLNKDYTVESLISNEIPYVFLNKLEESNAIMGQQQLEALDQIINIFNNKNREEKIELLKRNHIQKCIQWCERNQLPHNKFIDKVNIFLAPKKEGDKMELDAEVVSEVVIDKEEEEAEEAIKQLSK